MPEITQLAARQLRDYDAHTPGTMFAESISLDVREAYAIQTEVSRLREQRGERLLGYKVGCTSPTIQRQLNISHPVFGRLFDSDSWESKTDFASTRFANPAIEGELAVRLARDLTVDSSDEEIFDVIDSVFAVIELHNLVFRRGSPTAEELIANNAIHAGFVYPTDLSPYTPHEPGSLQIEINDAIVATVPGTDLIRTIVGSLNWLSHELHHHGLGLLAGQTILCGSVAEVFPVTANSRIVVAADRFGSVECTIN